MVGQGRRRGRGQGGGSANFDAIFRSGAVATRTRGWLCVAFVWLFVAFVWPCVAFVWPCVAFVWPCVALCGPVWLAQSTASQRRMERNETPASQNERGALKQQVGGTRLR